MNKLDDIKKSFVRNCEMVKELMNFDRIILDFCISHIKDLNDDLKSLDINNPYLLADSTLNGLVNIREHDSMRPQYQSIFNQCLVLLVSHFTSAMEDLFRTGVDILIVKNRCEFNGLNESIKLSFSELRMLNFDLSGNFGDLLLKKKGISFQDMQSLNRTYNQFFGFEFPFDKALCNLIFAQAARHAIIHSSSKVDDKFINQVRSIEKRDIQPLLKKGDTIEISPEELELISKNMIEIIDCGISKIEPN